MNEDTKDISQETACGCEGETCSLHTQEEVEESGFMTKHRGSEEIALAFLLALTPLVVLTFFGQVGLL